MSATTEKAEFSQKFGNSIKRRIRNYSDRTTSKIRRAGSRIQNPEARNCQRCGTHIPPLDPCHILHASNELICVDCIARYQRDRRNEREMRARVVLRINRECVICGNQFDPPRNDAKYCSSACRQAAYRQRKEVRA